MKLQDLKNTMVVEARNGEKYIVIDNLLVGLNEYMTKDEYYNNLKIRCNTKSRNYYISRNWDIMKIYEVVAYGYGLNEILNPRTNYGFVKLIWERKEV